MTITGTEKQHWEKRITRKIDKAIDAVWQENPALKNEVEEKAKQAFIDRFPNIPFGQREELLRKKAALDKKVPQIYETIEQHEATIAGHWPKASDWPHREFSERYDKLMVKERQRLLAECSAGQRILELEREKDELNDTVWLATSCRQMKELWKRFGDVLEDAPTRMQENRSKTNRLFRQSE